MHVFLGGAPNTRHEMVLSTLSAVKKRKRSHQKSRLVRKVPLIWLMPGLANIAGIIWYRYHHVQAF